MNNPTPSRPVEHCILIWCGDHQTEAATTHPELLRSMIRTEMLEHGGVDIR